MQFSNLRFGHGLFDPLIVTFQGQTLFWTSMLPKAPHIQKKLVKRELAVENHPKGA